MLKITEILKTKSEFIYKRDLIYYELLATTKDKDKEKLKEQIALLNNTIDNLDQLAEKLSDLDYYQVDTEEF